METSFSLSRTSSNVLSTCVVALVLSTTPNVVEVAAVVMSGSGSGSGDKKFIDNTARSIEDVVVGAVTGDNGELFRDRVRCSLL